MLCLLLTCVTAADESLKFWKIFEKKAGSTSVARDAAATGKGEQLVKHMTIR